MSNVDFGSSDPYDDNSAGSTPRQFNVDQDARSQKGGGEYPNYWSHKTRSGHSFIMDDSPGNETVTLQHRSGTAIQMRPDGGMTMTTHNGKYEVVFGENRVTVSGAQDITVKGDASFRVYGDYNVTCHKDYNLTVLGNWNITAKNINKAVRGTIDTESKTMNTKTTGSQIFNSQGAIGMSAIADFHRTSGGSIFDVAYDNFTSTAGAGNNQATMLHQNLALGGETVLNYPNKTVKGMYGSMGTAGPHHVKKYGVSLGSILPLMNMIWSNGTVQRIIEGTLKDQVVQDVNQNFEGSVSQQIAENKSVKVGGSSSETVTTGNKIVSVQGGSMDLRAPTGTANFAGGTTNEIGRAHV